MLDRTYRPSVIPRYFFNKITDITPNDLVAMGAKAIAIDLDNTTVYDSSYVIFKGIKEWVKNMVAAGFPVMVISNTYNKRAKILASKFGGIPFIGHSGKPNPKCYFDGAKMLGVDVSELAMVGDQLFTDVVGANDAGAISVRVRYRLPEIVAGIRYLLLRKREKSYLIKAGFEDKV